jgi:hypothetical protein
MSEQDISTESVRATCRVFISYSHDSPEHQQRVLALAERLRKDGVDAQLNQYVAGTPAKGWLRWMEDKLDWAQFVLVICTETYQGRFLRRQESDNGKGADWEGSLITLEVYHTRSDTSKFVPVLFDDEDKRFIPGQLRGLTHYLLSSEDNYAKLYAFLTGQADVVPSSESPLKVVFLAECVFDMQQERKKLQSLLEDQGWQVRPTFRYGLAGREAALQADLRESVAFIQLLESFPRENGFDRQQREAAKLKPRFLFRDANIALDEADEQHREFLTPPDVITCDFDDFQVLVADELKELVASREPAPIRPDYDLLDVLTSGEFPKQAEHRAINLAPAKAERNPVDCTVFAPARVERKQTGLLQVFLHAPGDRTQAEAAAEKFDPESKERGHRSLVLDAPIGTTFAFDVEIEGFVFPDRMDTLIWTGHPQSATFRFEVLEECEWGQHTGTVRISIDGAPVGRISFQIMVVRNARNVRNRPVGKEARHYHACFCSYSSLDREEMLKRAQGLQAAGLETFIDVLKLRPGDIWNPKIFAAIDESDLFVVIWSKNALDSKWVEKESRYALKRYKQYGRPDFRPIPVEGPPIASVPHGLQAYHFNDELLGLIRAAELERRERKLRQGRAGTG